MTLTNSDIAELTAFRRDLHRYPEISGEEEVTARRVCAALDPIAPDEVITGLGGHGVAAVFNGRDEGPTVLFRCELDALPIFETGAADHRSTIDGKGHLCGHDGHMTIIVGLARMLSREKPAKGRAVLLFQPAEETGAGAAAVIDDPQYPSIAPDYAFSLHNLPGLPLGEAAITAGPVNCASRGMRISLLGKPSHASEPENGVSPMQAVSELMPALAAFSRGAATDPDFTLVTVTHATMGAPAFGISPGEASIFATLRTLTDDRMDHLCARAAVLLETTATKYGLQASYDYDDIFLHCENEPEATAILRRAMESVSVKYDDSHLPLRFSEDFGRFGQASRSAMFFLGSGVKQPALHNPDYDFPDDLIPIGAGIFERVARDILG